MGVWHGQGCGLRAAFFFHVFFEILFYSVMQEHTGARDGGVARQGGGGGLNGGTKKNIFNFLFKFFLFFNLALWWRQYECSGGSGKNSKNFKNFQKKIYLIFQY